MTELSRLALAGKSGLAAGLVMTCLAATACDLPFGLGLPTTRALESGAANALSTATSLELTGSYTESDVPWTIDLQIEKRLTGFVKSETGGTVEVTTKPQTEHMTLASAAESLEVIVVGDAAYFRGKAFLVQHMGTDPASLDLINAAGGAWWNGSAKAAPDLVDFVEGSRLQTDFLGAVVKQRTDHVLVDGVDTVDLAGPRADAYISEAQPYHLVRLHLRPDATVAGLTAADLHYGSFNKEFGIVAPSDVINFADLSTLPPSYTVLSVDTSECGVPTCLVSAELKNLGGTNGARTPSTITFVLTDLGSGRTLGTCNTVVQPDVGYNSSTTVSCRIAGLVKGEFTAASITATPSNPGRA